MYNTNYSYLQVKLTQSLTAQDELMEHTQLIE